jgi:hypothetical protein
MGSGPVSANVEFTGLGLRFFESQSAAVQADLIVISRSLFDEPYLAVGDMTKLLVPVGKTLGVVQYRRAYVGERYWMLYDYAKQPPLLTVFDCGFS